MGVLSYSLYLWQQLFLDRHATSYVNAFPLNLVLAVSVALASYFLLEKPLLKFRRRLRPDALPALSPNVGPFSKKDQASQK